MDEFIKEVIDTFRLKAMKQSKDYCDWLSSLPERVKPFVLFLHSNTQSPLMDCFKDLPIADDVKEVVQDQIDNLEEYRPKIVEGTVLTLHGTTGSGHILPGSFRDLPFMCVYKVTPNNYMRMDGTMGAVGYYIHSRMATPDETKMYFDSIEQVFVYGKSLEENLFPGYEGPVARIALVRSYRRLTQTPKPKAKVA